MKTIIISILKAIGLFVCVIGSSIFISMYAPGWVKIAFSLICILVGLIFVALTFYNMQKIKPVEFDTFNDSDGEPKYNKDIDEAASAFAEGHPTEYELDFLTVRQAFIAGADFVRSTKNNKLP